jgi:hypothetical protein
VLAVAAVPLLVRRIWPIPVFAVVLALNAGAGLWGHVHAVNGLALLIALYTVAAMNNEIQAIDRQFLAVSLTEVLYLDHRVSLSLVNAGNSDMANARSQPPGEASAERPQPQRPHMPQGLSATPPQRPTGDEPPQDDCFALSHAMRLAKSECLLVLANAVRSH